jgi:hypothetical protein
MPDSAGAGTLRTLENARALGWGQIGVLVWWRLAGIVGLGRNLFELRLSRLRRVKLRLIVVYIKVIWVRKTPNREIAHSEG